jgi:short-subunit dehydrogenase
MPHRNLTGRRALITGASGGIGRALAFELSRRGAHLVLLARREKQLNEVVEFIRQESQRPAVGIVGDVTDAGTRQFALEAAQREFGGLDILVNNAGVSAHGAFADARPDRLRAIFETNFFAAVELIRAALPLMRVGQQSIVVNVGSILGKRAVPDKSEYCASKFALHGFSEALRAELAIDGISVLVAAVGPTETEFFEHLIEDRGAPPRRIVSGASPERVASLIVGAIQHGRREIVVGWQARLLDWANRVCPRAVDRYLARPS